MGKLSRLSKQPSRQTESHKRLWTILNKDFIQYGKLEEKSVENNIQVEEKSPKEKDNIFQEPGAKYYSLPNYCHFQKTVSEIKHSLFDLESLLKKNEQNEYLENIENKELQSENNYLKMKVNSLEMELTEKNERIRMLEKLVLETHL